ALGVTASDARELRADVAVLRAALAQDAGFTFVLEGSLELVDGIGALLRWTDAATPHETAPAYTADSHRRGQNHHPRGDRPQEARARPCPTPAAPGRCGAVRHRPPVRQRRGGASPSSDVRTCADSTSAATSTRSSA